MPSKEADYRDQMMREILVANGHDPAEVDKRLFGGPTPNPFNAGDVDPNASFGQLAADLEIEGLQKRGFHMFAGDVELGDMATWLTMTAGSPEALNETMMGIRTGWAEGKFDVSVGITQAIGDIRDAKEQSGMAKVIAGMLGSDPAQLSMGGAEVLGRPQQTLYGLLSGEGTAAFSRMMPKVVLYDDSNGGTKEVTPIEAAWHALVSDKDDWEFNMEQVRSANAQYQQNQLLEFIDVVDAWAGKETMDEIYHSMHEQGIFGKIKMAGLATSYAAAEIFADPLIIADSIAVIGVRAMRLLGTTAQQAVATARIARRTNRLDDTVVAGNKAEAHLKKALEQHQIERSAESMGRLQQAERNYAERIDDILAQKNLEGVDRIYNGPQRGNPKVLETREVMQLPFEIVPISPTRTNVVERAARVVDDIDNLLDTASDDLAKMKAEGSPATPEELLTFDKEIRNLERIKRRIIDDPDSVPDIIPFQAGYLRTRTAEEIADIRHADRMNSMNRPTTDFQPRPEESMQASLFDDAEVAARIAAGPDDAEYAAEGLARLVDGADIDEIGVPTSLMPEYHAKTGGREVMGVKDGFIDLDHAKRSLDEIKAKATEGQGELYDAVRKDLEKAEKTGEQVKYDDSWLPSPRKNIEDEMYADWQTSQLARFGDTLAQGMAPGAWRVRIPAILQRPLMHLREPMRVLEEMDPGVSWPLIRNSMMNAEAEKSRLMAVFNDAFERFGAVESRAPGPLRKALQTDAPRTVRKSQERSAELMDILETPRDSEAWLTKMEALTPDERAAVHQIRHELDLYGDKLGFSGTDKFVEGYMPHAFDKAWFDNGAMPPEMKGMHRNGHIFLGHMLGRTGQDGYVKDAVSMLEAYTHGVTRKMYMEPALETFRKRAGQIARKRGNPWYASYADLTVAQLKGEPSLAGQLADHVGGSLAVSMGKNYKPGAISRRLMMIPQLTYGAILGGNRRYPIMAVATSLVTTGARYGMFRTLKGMFMSATPEGQAIFRHLNGNEMWKRIFEDADKLDGFASKFTRVMSGGRFLSPSIQDSENFIRGMTFWAAIDETLTKMGMRTLDDAVKAKLDNKVLFDAMRSTEEVNHFFGTGAKPPIFSKVSKSVSATSTQFLSFGPKQTEMLAQLLGENPGKIARFLMLSGWMTRVAAQDMGIDISDYLGFNYAKSYGIRDVTTPGVELLGASVKAMAMMTAFAAGRATMDETQRATEDWGTAVENIIPLLTAARSISKSIEAEVTGVQTIPGRGAPRPVDTSITGKGKGQRGEATAMLTGARSVKERATQEARNKIRLQNSEVAFEKRVLVERAFRMIRDGDNDGFDKQVERLMELNVPFGDIADRLVTKKEVEILYWHIQELRKNPKQAHKVQEILEGYGIMGDGNE